MRIAGLMPLLTAGLFLAGLSPTRAQLAVLHTFSGSDGVGDFAGLVQGTDGNFYGTAFGGGANGNGTIFKVSPTGAFTTLYNFTASSAQSTNTDGANPKGGLVRGTDGNFYGVTHDGGANGNGTVFKVSPSGAFTALHSFTDTDGIFPNAGLIQASDGNFYGTAYLGGANGNGTVFKVSPSGAFTILHAFTALNQSLNMDGANPEAGLIQASDGNFYGSTTNGGATYGGTLFRMTPNGTVTALHNLTQSNTASPAQLGGAMIQASDGNFYGTVYLGGANDAGTLYRMTPNGAFTTLYNFPLGSNGSNSAAAGPTMLIQGTDGNLYGTTAYGGGSNDGTVFRFTGPPVVSNTVTIASAANISGDYFSPPGYYGANLLLMVTPVLNPGGASTGVYSNHPIGVWTYTRFAGPQWAIFNEDVAPMTAGAAFYVWSSLPGANAYTHFAVTANSSGSATFLANSFSSNNPGALVFVTPNWNPGGVGGAYNNHPLGVSYDNLRQLWAVVNEDGAAMVAGEAFNVFVMPAGPACYTHVVAYGNNLGYFSALDNPLLNGNPNAVLFATQNVNPGGGGPVFNSHTIGVGYSTWLQRWCVFNEDQTNLPTGAAFNIWIVQ